MKTKIINPILLCSLALLAVVGLSGCASATKTYTADGREAFSLNCSGTARNWGHCTEKAGEICQTKGYDIIQREGENLGNITTANSTASANGSAFARPGDYRALATANAQSNYMSMPLVKRTMLIACKN